MDTDPNCLEYNESGESESTGITRQKLFTPKAIGVGAFLGGPLAATILIGRNFHQLGYKRSRNQTYLLGLGLTLSYFWLIFEIPAGIADKIPTPVYGGFVSLIAYMLTENLQGETLRKHFENLGQKASGWAVVGWSTLGLTFSLGLMMLYLPFIPPFDFEEAVYTEGLLGNEIYYSANIDETILKELGEYLIENEYFDAEYSVPIQLIRDESGYQLTLSCYRDQWTDPETIAIFRDFAKGIEEGVLGETVHVCLVDQDLRGVHRKKL